MSDDEAATEPERPPWEPARAEELTAASRAGLLDELRAVMREPHGSAWRIDDLLHRYRNGLRRLPIARNPHSGGVFWYGVDTFGLDGPWWDYHAPIRPSDPLPLSVFSITGAMKLGRKLPMFGHLAKVGPGVPFVVPRLLAHDGVTAVISQIEVGGATAWPIVYFAREPLLDHHRFNTWGTNRYWWQDATGQWKWNDCTEDDEELDFDLAPWIEQGRVRWIAPGDGDLELHDTVKGCPYLGLSGETRFQRVSLGEAWTQDGPVATAPARARRQRSAGSRRRKPPE